MSTIWKLQYAVCRHPRLFNIVGHAISAAVVAAAAAADDDAYDDKPAQLLQPTLAQQSQVVTTHPSHPTQ